jgi:hypothetical protein
VAAISIVYPKEDPNLPNELISLRPFPTEVRILTGGGGAAAYGDSLMRIGILQPHNLDAFSLQLDDLRELRPSAHQHGSGKILILPQPEFQNGGV